MVLKDTLVEAEQLLKNLQNRLEELNKNTTEEETRNQIKEIKDENELIQYFVVNQDLDLSPQKLAIHIAHIATSLGYQLFYNYVYNQWVLGKQKKILLKGSQKDLEYLLKYGYFFDRDLDVDNSDVIIAIGLPPMARKEALFLVGHLSLY